jgi:hypothetical protein
MLHNQERKSKVEKLTTFARFYMRTFIVAAVDRARFTGLKKQKEGQQFDLPSPPSGDAMSLINLPSCE